MNENAKAIISNSNKILIFTGAGMSVSSGIPTFRDIDGIWKSYNPFFWATKSGLFFNYIFKSKKFCRFLKDVLSPIVSASPNVGHLSITELSRRRNVYVITQNIDNLHQNAGTENVGELHGNIYEIRQKDDITIKLTTNEMKNLLDNIGSSNNKKSMKKALEPFFNRKKGIRPNVVLFGESINVKVYYNALLYLQECDCLIVIGTSLNVYPAANIVIEAKRLNKPIINIGFDLIPGGINLTGMSDDILPSLLNN